MEQDGVPNALLANIEPTRHSFVCKLIHGSVFRSGSPGPGPSK